jgi:Chaperone of endosialidase
VGSVTQPYTATCTFTLNSDQVVGTLTAFHSALHDGDDAIAPNGSRVFVKSVQDATHLTLAKNYTGPTTTQAVDWARHSDAWGLISNLAIRAAAIEESIERGHSLQSTASLAISAGTKVFTGVETGLKFLDGITLKATSRANSANWMQGDCTYSDSTLTMVVTAGNFGGSGTFSDWNINLTGKIGVQGVAGVGALAGGTTGQYPRKKSPTNYDAEWVNPPSSLFNMLTDAGRFAGEPEPTNLTATTFALPAYAAAYNGCTITQGDKFLHNNTTYGGTTGILGAVVDALVTKQHPSSTYRRYGVEFFVLNITAGAGTAGSLTMGGVPHYLALNSTTPPSANKNTLNYWVRCESGSIGIYSALATVYFDGVLQTASYPMVTPAMGWTQVTITQNLDPKTAYGYSTNFWRIYATPGTVWNLACPTLFPGLYDVETAGMYSLVPSLEAYRSQAIDNRGAIRCERQTNAFGSSNVYTALAIGAKDGVTAANGGLFGFLRYDKATEIFTGLSGWDDGVTRRLFFGGGGWSCPDATDLYFYTAPTYDETNNAGVVRMRIASSGVVIPGADNTQSFGSASLRWSTIYAGTGTINTSDATTKKIRGPLTDAELRAWGRVTWQVFQFLDSVAEKGDAARLHAGLVAQDVLAAFAVEGLDARRYALFCEDEIFEDVTDGVDDAGRPIIKSVSTGKKRRGLRYDQCQAFEAAYQRARIAALEAKLITFQWPTLKRGTPTEPPIE